MNRNPNDPRNLFFLREEEEEEKKIHHTRVNGKRWKDRCKIEGFGLEKIHEKIEEETSRTVVDATVVDVGGPAR